MDPPDGADILRELKTCWIPHEERAQEFEQFIESFQTHFDSSLEDFKQRLKEVASEYDTRWSRLRDIIEEAFQRGRERRERCIHEDETSWWAQDTEIYNHRVGELEKLWDYYERIEREANSTFDSLWKEQKEILTDYERKYLQDVWLASGKKTRLQPAMGVSPAPMKAVVRYMPPSFHTNLSTAPSLEVDIPPSLTEGSEAIIHSYRKDPTHAAQPDCISNRASRPVLTPEDLPIQIQTSEPPINSGSPTRSKSFSLSEGSDCLDLRRIMDQFLRDEDCRNAKFQRMSTRFEHRIRQLQRDFDGMLSLQMEQLSSQLDPAYISTRSQTLFDSQIVCYELALSFITCSLKRNAELSVGDLVMRKQIQQIQYSIHANISLLKIRLSKQRLMRLQNLGKEICKEANIHWPGLSPEMSAQLGRSLDADVEGKHPSPDTSWRPKPATPTREARAELMSHSESRNPVTFSFQSAFTRGPLLPAGLPVPGPLRQSNHSPSDSEIKGLLSKIQTTFQNNEIERQSSFARAQDRRKEAVARFKTDLRDQFRKKVDSWTEEVLERQITVTKAQLQNEEQEREAKFSRIQAEQQSEFQQTLASLRAADLVKVEEQLIAARKWGQAELGWLKTRTDQMLTSDLKWFSSWINQVLSSIQALERGSSDETYSFSGRELPEYKDTDIYCYHDWLPPF